MLTVLIGIFVIQIVYVSFFTLRMILTLKGQKYVAAALSMAEIVIYVTGLNMVLAYLDHFASLLVYALGYGLGVLVGSWIEERLALGYVTVKVISNRVEGTLPADLRKHGYGVTVWIGSGRDGERLVMEILSRRSNEKQLYNTVLASDPQAFIVTLETKQLHGGFWVKTIRKRNES